MADFDVSFEEIIPKCCICVINDDGRTGTFLYELSLGDIFKPELAYFFSSSYGSFSSFVSSLTAT
jgi:hypothetical protein